MIIRKVSAIYVSFLVLIISSCKDNENDPGDFNSSRELQGGVESGENRLSDESFRPVTHTPSEIRKLLEVGMPKDDVKKILGEPAIDGVTFFIYKFWDKSDVRNIGRDGYHGFNVHFEKGKLSEVSWSQ